MINFDTILSWDAYSATSTVVASIVIVTSGLFVVFQKLKLALLTLFMASALMVCSSIILWFLFAVPPVVLWILAGSLGLWPLIALRKRII